MKTLQHSLFALTAASALSFATTAYAVQEEGSKDIEFTGGFTHASGADIGTVNADVAYGYYIRPRISLGVRQTLSYSFIDNASDTWIASTIPFVEYNFQTKNDMFRPFVGAFVGAAYNDDDVTGTIGPTVGFKYYLNDSTAVVARYRYEWFFNDLTINDVTDSADANNVVTVGMSYTWK